MLLSAMRPRWAPIFWVRGLFWLQKPPAFNVVANDRLDKHGRNWKQLSRQQRCRSQGQGLASWGQQAASKVRNAEVSRARSRRPGRRGGQGGPAGSAQGAAPAPASAQGSAPTRARRPPSLPGADRRGHLPCPRKGPARAPRATAATARRPAQPRPRPPSPGTPAPPRPPQASRSPPPALSPASRTRPCGAHCTSPRRLGAPGTQLSRHRRVGHRRRPPRQSAPRVSQSGARPRGPGCEHARCARPRPGRRRAGAAGREPLAAEAVGMRSSARAALGHGGVRHAQ